jgi:hypothetical protein
MFILCKDFEIHPGNVQMVTARIEAGKLYWNTYFY